MRERILLIFVIVVSGLMVCKGEQLMKDDCLKEAIRRFENPDKNCQTKVWWFHGETETTKSGITADLEEFAEKGIGGVVYYDQVHGKGEKALPALSPEWWEMLKYAACEAKRLGLTFEASLSNGYVGGGPWITPDMAMQRLECIECELTIAGDSILLPSLPQEKHAKDVAVIMLTTTRDSSLIRNISYRARGQGKAYVQAMNRPLRYDEKINYDHSFSGYKFEPIPSPGQIETLDEKGQSKIIKTIPPHYSGSYWPRISLAIPPTPAKGIKIATTIEDERYLPFNIDYSPYAKTDLWEEKVGLTSNFVENQPTNLYAEAELFSADEVKDVSHLFNEGIASTPKVKEICPNKKALFLRFYSTPTGAKTKHARPGMIGYECDKLSKEAAKLQYDSYFKRIVDSIRAWGAEIEGLAIDSHEAGSQNWTANFEDKFLQLRGYQLRPWLPVMAGYIIKSEEATLKVQQDVRRTIADLVATEYFGTLDSLCRKDNLICTAQAAGNGQTLVSDNIYSKCMVQKPQGEFWAYQQDGAYDIKEASSAAHLYGKPIASAEAYTDFDFSKPLSYLKPVMDHAYAMGLQEFVVCAAAYQPWGKDTIPGSTGGGRQYAITRTNTQWNSSNDFWKYQARCAAIMRMGENVTDLLVLFGNDAPMKLLTHRLPEVPPGVDFDVATDKAFINSSRDYKAIALSKDAMISTEAMDKIMNLQKNGIDVFNYGDSITLTRDVNSLHPTFTMHHHRHLSDADIYFIYNPADKLWTDTLRFSSPYHKAQIWTPADGRRYSLAENAEGIFPINLRPKESCFVVMSDCEEHLTEWNIERMPIMEIERWDTPMGIIPGTYNWTSSPDNETKYFSGTMPYESKFNLAKIPGKNYYLSCDSIASVATVTINDKKAGTLWCSPWELDITDIIIDGENKISLNISNVNTNRIIGDKLLPVEERKSFCYPEFSVENIPLAPSGILSPIKITSN